jgi:hypothetical protein
MVDIYGGYPNSTLLLENLSLLKLGNIFTREQGLSYSSLFFSGRHLSTHCFRYLRHLSIFSFNFLFFMNNFCVAHASFLQQKLLTDRNKNLEHLFGGWKTY